MLEYFFAFAFVCLFVWWWVTITIQAVRDYGNEVRQSDEAMAAYQEALKEYQEAAKKGGKAKPAKKGMSLSVCLSVWTYVCWSKQTPNAKMHKCKKMRKCANAQMPTPSACLVLVSQDPLTPDGWDAPTTLDVQ